MPSPTKLKNPSQCLFSENSDLLHQGYEVLAKLPTELFTSIDERCLGGSIGGHVRHCVEFYRIFLNGLETGNLDYDARPRDAILERDPSTARAAIEGIRNSLASAATRHYPESPLNILENHHGGAPCWSLSSTGRELRFLLSHTVHHYALIAILLRLRGMETPANFGVAPSTIKYHANSKSHSACAL